MTEFTGVISRIISRPFGNKTMYSIALSGQEGLFGLGNKAPPPEGTTISFKANKNEKGFMAIDTKTIEELKDGNAGPASVAGASSGISAGRSFNAGSPKSDFQLREQYWGAKEARDIRNDSLRELGASRNTAIAIIELMVKSEAVKLPAGPKREGFLWDLIDKYAQKLMKTEEKVTAEPEPANEVAEEQEEEWN